MYKADLKHSDQSLEDKLHQLYNLSPRRVMELGFRPPFMSLLEKFDNPHLKLPPTVHIAGTNGKGSTLAIMRAIFEAMEQNVHRFTSPHLRRFNERIVLEGREVDDEVLEDLIDEAIDLNDGGEVTFFEVTTAMAFAAFSKVPADVCLVEVGLGGRLDCTNVIEEPAITIIGKISMDHTEWLGDSLEAIAAEKAGIMKPGAPCIIGAQMDMDTVLPVFERRAEEVGATLYVYGRDWCIEETESGILFDFRSYRFEFCAPSLIGPHQTENAGMALAALYVLRDRFEWSPARINNGLQNVYWPGRLEHISEEPEVWYDGGHNDSAAQALVQKIEQWKLEDNKPLHLIIGMKADKDALLFIKPLLPYAQSVSIIPVEKVGSCLQRCDISELEKDYESVGFCDFSSVSDALKHHSECDGRILICGSLYLAAQIA